MPIKPVDQAIKVILGPCIDDSDFKSREELLTYDQAGMEIDVILEKHDGTVSTTAVTPTTGGDYDWAHTDQGYYELELPASGGADYNNDTEGILTVVGYCTGVLPFRSQSYDIVPEKVYNSLIEGSDNLETDPVSLDGDAAALDNVVSVFKGTGHTDDVDLTARSLALTNDAGVGLVVSGSTSGMTVDGAAGPGIHAGGTTFGFEMTASAGPGLSCVASAGNNSGIVATGFGGGEGIIATGGGTSGHGIQGVGGTANGKGIYGVGTGTGEGLYCKGGNDGASGIKALGGTTNSIGIEAQGVGTHEGFRATGGTSSGIGIQGVGGTPNGIGIHADGSGTGAGLKIDGGSFGIDCDASAGPSAQFTGTTHGLEIAASAGPGIEVDGTTLGIEVDASDGPGVHIGGTTIGLDIDASAGMGLDIDGTTGGFDVRGSAGPGGYIASTGAGGHGLHILGNTGGLGVRIIGGNNGGGVGIYGGAAGDAGLHIEAQNAGESGLEVFGAGGGAGLLVTGGATGHGVQALGGATSGDGIYAAGQTLGDGMTLVGAGVGQYNLNLNGLDADVTLRDGMFAYGTVWVDDTGTASTAWPYGTAPYPTDTIARGKTIADANGLAQIQVRGDHTLAADMEGYNFIGGLYLDTTKMLDLGGFSVEHSSFRDLVVTGVGGNAALIGDQTTYTDCYLITHTNIHGWVYNGRVEGACSIRDGGYATFHNVLFGSGVACTLTLQAPAVCDIENMAGELTLAWMDGGVCSISMTRGSILTIDATCTAGTITVTGAGTVTDNSGGGCTVTVEVAAANLTQILGVAQSITDLKDFADTGYDPTAHKVQGVVLTDGCTSNADMRGTDGASTLTPAQVNTQVLDVLNVDTLIDGKTFVESQQIIAAGVLGVCAGAGTGTETFDGLDGVTLRATVTVDADGNRTVVVY